jgi:hypothetical protein
MRILRVHLTLALVIAGGISAAGCSDKELPLECFGNCALQPNADTATSPVANAVPVANAGSDANAKTNTLVVLDGSASSDANYDPLTFNWNIVSTPQGSSTTLSDPSIFKPTFTPDLAGEYIISLVVSDGTDSSTEDTVNISVVDNSGPVANAGSDVNALPNTFVLLDGSASSDADDDPLTYDWSVISWPEGGSATLSNPSNVGAAFAATAGGEYVIGLVVSDGIDSSTEDTVNITVVASVSHIYDTGQMQCFDSAIEIPCPSSVSGYRFYGQDAQYSTNPLRFTDNGSTVTDILHGLTWQKSDSGTKYNWYQATGIFDATYNPDSTDVCGSLSLAGYSDWRLPSMRELVSILNYGIVNDEILNFAIGTADGNYFQSSSSEFWTSTIQQDTTPLPWAVDGWGVISPHGDPYYPTHIRCVRGGAWGQNDYTDNGDGTVTDNMSGLVWQQIDDGLGRSWEDALAYCENLALGGSSDWRLPDIKELNSLVTINAANETLSNPAIDTTYFPTTAALDGYWSSTSVAADPTFAWSVYFSGGFNSAGDGKTSNKACRCVR